MVISAVMTANLFNGLNTNVWTAWVFFATTIGIVLVWVYTVRLHLAHISQDILTSVLGDLFHHFSWLVPY